jgi:hypothetical protein
LQDVADTPLTIGDPIYGPATPNFTDFMAPGIVIVIIYFLVSML